MENERPLPVQELPILPLASITILAGVGGMAASFFFLASSSDLDVAAGAIGFVAGAVLIGGGLISLALQNRSPQASTMAKRALRCLYGLLPVVVAFLGWPILYFGTLILVIVMPVVMLVCAVWAWWGSRSVAANLAPSLGPTWVRVIHLLVFVTQVVAIAASLPVFVWLLRTLESMGYKVGWS
jgi:hypothetical protein